MIHHAIIVTCEFGDPLLSAYREAQKHGLSVTGLYQSERRFSFFVLPDGHEEGSYGSNIGDRQRRAFTDWLREQQYVDGNSWFSWVELNYGDSNLPVVCGANTKTW